MILCENIFTAPPRSNRACLLKLDYIKIFFEILYLEGHPNCITGSKVTAILLNGWILPIGGASAVEGLQSTGIPRLVIKVLIETCLYGYPTSLQELEPFVKEKVKCGTLHVICDM